MDRQPLSVTDVRRVAPYRGGERNEQSEHTQNRNVTEHEPNIPNSGPSRAFGTLKNQVRDLRAENRRLRDRIVEFERKLAEAEATADTLENRMIERIKREMQGGEEQGK